MYEIKTRYKGLVPMMMDRFADPTQTEKPKGKKKKGRDEREIIGKLHKDKKGVFVPADNIRMMLIGNKHRRGAAEIYGQEVETKKGKQLKSICTGCIWILGIEDPKDPSKCYIQKPRKTYDDVDERSFINANGSRSMAYRPIIKLPWSVNFIIQVTDDSIDHTFVRALFDTAGLRCGICAYGPTFGRCVIDKWEV